MADKVMHFEIHGRDGKRLQEFYASLFGWRIDTSNPMQGSAIGLLQAGRS